MSPFEKRLHQAWVKLLCDAQAEGRRFVFATFTLKQCIQTPDCRPEFVTRESVEVGMRYLQNKLNRRLFGNASKRGKRVKWVDTSEGGRGTFKRLHQHALIEVPANYDAAFFALKVKSVWWGCRWADREMRVEPAIDYEAVASYIVKTGGDAVNLKTLHI